MDNSLYFIVVYCWICFPLGPYSCFYSSHPYKDDNNGISLNSDNNNNNLKKYEIMKIDKIYIEDF